MVLLLVLVVLVLVLVVLVVLVALALCGQGLVQFPHLAKWARVWACVWGGGGVCKCKCVYGRHTGVRVRHPGGVRTRQQRAHGLARPTNQ